MLKSGSTKSKRARGKLAISDSDGQILRTRFGGRAVFQRKKPGPSETDKERQDCETFEAVVIQAGFSGGELRSAVQLPLNSDIWRKLSTERKEGEK